jgi:peptide/nickel transport system ATP-binding protein/oligopeptide transport system ATP-binding protein
MTTAPQMARQTDVAGEPAPATPLVQVENLAEYFPITGGVLQRRVGDVKAVDDVSFEVRRGETLGLVGESGCGKTTVGRLLLRLIDPTAGRIVFDGTDITKLSGTDLKPFRRRMQIIFQDPFASLDPRTPIGASIGDGLRIHGMGTPAERRDKVAKIMELVGLQPYHARRYPHEFSGGQRQRIGIARALVLEPDLVVCDEPVSALDVSIQAQVLNLLRSLQRELGLTYVFIAHNMGVVEHISDRVAVMYLGGMAEIAGARDIYRLPLHPYTIALLSAVPVADPAGRDRRRRIILLGDVPSPVNPPSGCRFHTRCWLRKQLGNPERCATERPAVRDVKPGHGVACHFAEQLVDIERRDQLISAAAAVSDARTVSDEEVVTPGPMPAPDEGGVFDRPGGDDIGGEAQSRL